jgi:hypothetical protein
VDDVEITRRLIDLFFVSVLLDAGAGDTWSFREPGSDKSYGRSEGIAVASLYMFNDGAFTSAADGNKSAVDGKGSRGIDFADGLTMHRTCSQPAHRRRIHSPLSSWAPESHRGVCIQNRTVEQSWKVSSCYPRRLWRNR